jgi:hypothetical protein
VKVTNIRDMLDDVGGGGGGDDIIIIANCKLP